MSNNGKYELEAESLFQEVFRLAFEETNWTLTYDKVFLQKYLCDNIIYYLFFSLSEWYKILFYQNFLLSDLPLLQT